MMGACQAGGGPQGSKRAFTIRHHTERDPATTAHNARLLRVDSAGEIRDLPGGGAIGRNPGRAEIEQGAVLVEQDAAYRAAAAAGTFAGAGCMDGDDSGVRLPIRTA